MTTKVNFSTPVGRIVQGDCWVAQDKDAAGQPRVVKQGPNVGQPNPQYFVALAFAKNDPAWPAFAALLIGEAVKHWPNLFPQQAPVNMFGVMATPCVIPDFAFKIKDGDSVVPDKKGKKNADKEGFPGHWIVSFASAYAPKIAQKGADGAWITLTDPASVKRGFYVQIAGSIDTNKSTQTPGMFVNLDKIAFVSTGPEIVGGVDFDTAFAAPAAMPPGVVASAGPQPVLAAGAHVMLPAAGGATYEAMIAAGWTDAAMIAAGMMAAPQPVVAAPPPPPPAVAAPPPPPAAVIVPPPPAAVVTPPPPAASVAPVMLPAAGGATYEAMIAAGWTEAQLVSGGMMAARPEPYSGFRDVAAAAVPTPPAPPLGATTASPTRTMTAAAAGKTYETFIGAGWTDEQLVANGYMTA